jgi:hypothetical protein
MDTSISVRVFEWRGELHLVVDRIYSAGHRRNAPRVRVAAFHGEALPSLLPAEAMEWAVHQMNLWMNAGFPTEGGVAVSASPSGDHRGDRASGAPPCADRGLALPSQTEPPSLEGRDGEAVSDGLKPLGTQPSLF